MSAVTSRFVILQLLVASANSAAAAQPELALTIEGERAPISLITLQGEIPRNHAVFQIIARSGPQHLGSEIEITLNGSRIPVIHLPSGEYPLLDLNSITPHIPDNNNLELVVIFSYGQRREDCFSNHDGRDYAEISVDRNREVSTHRVSFAGCELRARARRSQP